MNATGSTHGTAVQGRTWLEYAGTSLYTTWVRIEPERAFAYVADMTRHHEWAVHEITVTPAEPGPAHLGSRYTSSGRQGGRDWPSELEVTIFEPPTRFEFTATGGPVASRASGRIATSTGSSPSKAARGSKSNAATPSKER